MLFFSSFLSRLLGSVLFRRFLKFILRFLPTKWSALCFLWAQKVLVQKVDQMFCSLPSTGLDTGSLTEFQAFCRHMVKVFQSSPRTVLSRKIHQEVLALYQSDPKARQLCSLMNYDPVTQGTLQLKLLYETLSPGKLHAEYNTNLEKSVKSDVDGIVMNEIRKGMREKALLRNKEINEQQIDEAINKILATQAEKRHLASQKADEIWQLLQKDETYLRYQQIQQLWMETGVNRVVAQYALLDRSIGENRQSRGKGFEDARADVIFEMIRKILISRCASSYSSPHLPLSLSSSAAAAASSLPSSSSPPSSLHTILQGLPSLPPRLPDGSTLNARSVLRCHSSCSWLDERRKPVGELDLVVVAVTPNTSHLPDAPAPNTSLSCASSSNSLSALFAPSARSSTASPTIAATTMAMKKSKMDSPPNEIETVVAIVEIKSNCYELTSGLLEQHLPKAAVNHAIVTREGRQLTLASVPPIFLVTLIPDNDFILGAPPVVVKYLSEYLMGTPTLAPGSTKIEPSLEQARLEKHIKLQNRSRNDKPKQKPASKSTMNHSALTTEASADEGTETKSEPFDPNSPSEVDVTADTSAEKNEGVASTSSYQEATNSESTAETKGTEESFSNIVQHSNKPVRQLRVRGEKTASPQSSSSSSSSPVAFSSAMPLSVSSSSPFAASSIEFSADEDADSNGLLRRIEDEEFMKKGMAYVLARAPWASLGSSSEVLDHCKHHILVVL